MSVADERFWVVNEDGQTLFGQACDASLPAEWGALAGHLLRGVHPGPLSLAVPGADLTAWRLVAGDRAPGSPAAVVLRVRPRSRSVALLVGQDAAASELTPRQREVCEYAACGATVDEIAAHLDISAGTVRTHLKTVYRNLGVANRVELARALGALEPRIATAAE